MTATAVPRDGAVRAVLDHAAPHGGRGVLLLDGGSGAGKSVLADDI